MMRSERDIDLENELKWLKDYAAKVLKELDSFMQSDEQTDFSYDYLDDVHEALDSLINTI